MTTTSYPPNWQTDDNALNTYINTHRSPHASDGRIWIDRLSFESAEEPDGRCPSRIDLTGRDRLLASTRSNVLPAGDWRAVFILNLCPDACRRVMHLEMGVGDTLTVRSIPQGRAGTFQLQLDHTIEHPSAIELRLQLIKPAFHGWVHLSGAWLEAIRGAI